MNTQYMCYSGMGFWKVQPYLLVVYSLLCNVRLGQVNINLLWLGELVGEVLCWSDSRRVQGRWGAYEVWA